MNALAMSIGTAVALTSLGIAAPAAAQSAVRVAGVATVRVGPVRAGIVVRPANRVVYDYRDRRRDAREGRRRVNNGVAYCWEGHGHPAYGWRWCVNEGYIRPYHHSVRWTARYYAAVDLRPLPWRRSSARLNERRLRRVVGHRAFDRIHDHSHRIGAYGELTGRWVRPMTDAISLVVYVGDTPVAEFRDQDFDGHVDVEFRYLQR